MKSQSCLWYLPLIIFAAAACLAQTPADTVGTTENFYQTTGPTGQRIVLDHLGNVHITWMKAMPYPSVRHVYFNCKTPSGWASPGTGSQVNYGAPGAGYAQIALTSDNRSVIAYHKAPTDAESVYVAFDSYSCLSWFEYRRAPNRTSGRAFIWPYFSIGQNGNIHLTTTMAASYPPNQYFAYVRSGDNGHTWTTVEQVDGTTGGAIVATSRVSNKTAIVYARPVGDSNSYRNDIWLTRSQDGVAWDFDDGLFNITEYPGPDSLYANNDYDAIYDNNDNLHIVWVAQEFWNGTPEGVVHLYHYDTQSETIDEMTRYDIFPNGHCQFPVGQIGIDMVSLSVSGSGAIFATYSRFDTTDCSGAGKANADLFVQFSQDGGHFWSSPANITNTRTPDCGDGQCISEVFPSAAEVVDTYLRFMCTGYNGGPGLWDGPDSPVLYYEYPVTALGVDEHPGLPGDATLTGNYPNPFNAQTTISFALVKGGDVTLEIYDLLGRKIETLHQGPLRAGEYNIVWDAGDRASGIYYYSLGVNGKHDTRRMMLIK